MARCLLWDRSSLDRSLLRRRLAAHPDLRIVAEAATFGEARELLGGVEYDLVFSDTHLSGGSVFELAPFLRPGADLILVSASETHAIRAYEVGVLDYLLKPASPDRLALALRRQARWSRVAEASCRSISALGPDDKLPLRCGRTTRFAALGQISAITAQDNYSEVTLVSGHRAFLRRTLKAWENELPPRVFMRVHRTQIINLARVTACRRDGGARTFIDIEGLREPVVASRHRWRELRNRLQIEV